MRGLWWEPRNVYWRTAGSRKSFRESYYSPWRTWRTGHRTPRSTWGPCTRVFVIRRRHCNTPGPSAPGLLLTFDTRTKNWRTGLGRGRLCVYNPNTEVTSLYDATTNKVVGSSNVVFINTPSMMVSPPTNETMQHRRAGQHRRGGQHRHHQVSRRPRGR